ncbi:hypothetical protein HYDPIDRAFT_110252 [Hydnomerulius pinastri MD-312]|nr:hypothetical protein HYDPIDRAFT_110252 [Hydnomerulius pinastri MD-312]
MSVDLERTALLEDSQQGEDRHRDTEDVYKRFNYRQRRSILLLVAASGLTPMFVWKTFVPSIPQVAKDLDSDDATLDGRRLMYLWGIPFLCIGSIGVAMSTSIPALFFWRFVQSFGCSSRLALGSGVVGDIYRLEERGAALGVFFGVVLLGTMAAPVVGGAFTKYASWRDLHLAIAAWGCVEFFILYLSLPETSHSYSAHNKNPVPPRPRYWFVNPLKCMGLLRSPNLFLVVLGAPIAGRLSDVVIKNWRRKREGEWVAEDRLRATYIGGLILVPFSLVTFGLVTTYVEGALGLALSLVVLFFNGFGIDFVLNPVNSYCVDLLHSQSAEIMAAGNAFRSIIMAGGISAVLPMIERYGVLATNSITALLMLFGYGLIHLTIRYGDRMRESVDIGYTTVSSA